MSDFTHLHLHSHYSLLDGLGKIEPLLDRIKELNMNAVALTDHGAMYGVIEFYKAALSRNIKPIIGCEFYLAPNGHRQKRGKIDANPRHLTVLAHNHNGYKNLMKLASQASLVGYYYKPRIDYQLLQQYRTGLIILSGCINGDLPKAIIENRAADAKRLIKWHLDVFGRHNYYLEVQHHPHLEAQNKVNEALFKFGKLYNIHIVATTDAHYINSSDAEAHDVLLCVQTGKIVSDKNRMSMLDDDFSIKSSQEMKKIWRKHPEVIDNTERIADLVNITIEFGVNRLPRFPIPKGQTADGTLKKLCQQGLTNRYGKKLPAQALDRLNYELDVIKKTGYSSYFLIVADFVNEAKRRDILVGPGRGSAAGSLVSYLLSITNIDPLVYNLVFERFLNPERVSMPDIDLDFADDRRDEIISYVRDKYGSAHVAQIITFGTMAARASIRDAGRALGLPYAFCDTIAKTIPPMTNFADALDKSPELQQLYHSDPQAKRLIDTASKLEGVCRHASTHAAGVVVTDQPLTEYVPLQLMRSGQDNKQNVTVTQYNMNIVESLGLLKIDFLGLKNLTIIKNTLDRITSRFERTIDIDNLPLADQKTFELLQEGKTTGVFQLESAGIKRYLKELKPTEFEDIISIVALYRPGPMDSIPDFIAAKHGRRAITYLHPALKPILEKTYGIIVTQDQVLQISREFSGFSYAEADILRKAVGKKIKSLLDEQREKFIKGAIDTQNISRRIARQVWDFIEPFARYGFNRAHAACYAMIAYQTAYLKAHYPAEFMAALLTSDEGNMDRAAIEVAEALTMDLEILPPDINQSNHNFTVVQTATGQDAIRFGLSAIKNVGHNVVASLTTERNKNGPYKDIADLAARVNSKDFNRKSLESLARVGAFDCINERAQVLANIEKILTFNRTLHHQRDAGQKGLFGIKIAIAPPRLELDKTTPASKEERLKWEKELLGIYVSEHPLSDLQQELALIATPLHDLSQALAGQKVRVAGVIVRLTKYITKSNQPMMFVTIEDTIDSVEIIVFPSILEKTRDLWIDGATIIIEGELNDKDGTTKVLAEKAWPLNKQTLSQFKSAPRLLSTAKNRAASNSAPKNIGYSSPSSPATSRLITIHLPHHFSPDSVTKLKEVLTSIHIDSGVPVELKVPQNGTATHVNTSYKIPTDDDTMAKLKNIVGTHITFH